MEQRVSFSMITPTHRCPCNHQRRASFPEFSTMQTAPQQHELQQHLEQQKKQQEQMEAAAEKRQAMLLVVLSGDTRYFTLTLIQTLTMDRVVTGKLVLNHEICNIILTYEYYSLHTII